MDYNYIYKHLMPKLEQNTIFNIMLVLAGIRPTCWIDSEIYSGKFDINTKFTKKQLETYRKRIQKILDTLKDYGIKYKFTDILSNEGPLVYNILKTDPKLIKTIESSSIENIYPKPIFGKILGYPIAGISPDDASGQIFIKKIIKRNGYYREDELNIYGFAFPLKRINFVSKYVISKVKEINNFLQELDESLVSGFRLEY